MFNSQLLSRGIGPSMGFTIPKGEKIPNPGGKQGKKFPILVERETPTSQNSMEWESQVENMEGFSKGGKGWIVEFQEYPLQELWDEAWIHPQGGQILNSREFRGLWSIRMFSWNVPKVSADV